MLRKWKITSYLLATGGMLSSVVSCAHISTHRITPVDINESDYAFKEIPSAYQIPEKKHYILLMIDSLTSWRLQETIIELQREYDKQLVKTEKEAKDLKEKLDFFKDFELKMNVITPGFRTDKGLEGIIGGARGQFTTEYFAKRNYSRLQMLNQSYNRMFRSMGMSKNIDKMYIHAASFYKYGKQATQCHNWDMDEINVPQIVKDKMDMSHTTNNLWDAQQLVNSVKSIPTDKNTFSFFISNIIHDKFTYTYQFKNNSFFDMLVKIKKELVKKGIWDTTELMFVSDHGKWADPSSSKKYTGYPYYDQMTGKKLPWVDVQKDESGNISVKNHTNKMFEILKGNNKGGAKTKEIDNVNFAHTQAGILYKPIKSQGTKMQIDYGNLYINSDAISQLYFDIGVDPHYLEFDYYPHTNNLKTNKNNNGDFNSYVDNPFHKDLSKRRLFAFDYLWNAKGAKWGYWGKVYDLRSGTLFNGPWWTLKNDKPIFNKERAIRLNYSYFDDKVRNDKDENTSWLTKDIKKSEGLPNKDAGLKVMGKIIDAMDVYLQTH